MRQAIITKYLGPTNFRGSRIKATCNAMTVICGYDHSLDIQDNHKKVAAYLLAKLEWDTKNSIIGGALPNNQGYCFVLVQKDGAK